MKFDNICICKSDIIRFYTSELQFSSTIWVSVYDEKDHCDIRDLTTSSQFKRYKSKLENVRQQ